MHNDEEELSKTREMKFANLEKEIQETETSEKEPTVQKIHDINKLLEYAKNENNKLKDNPSNHENTSNYKLLETLENKVITKEDLTSTYNKPSTPNTTYNNQNPNKTQDSTSELKYQTKKISVNPSIDQIITSDSTSSLSLDILSDLKPNGDTGVTKPINSEESSNSEEDIDIIKDNLSNNQEDEEKDSSTFYTDIYKFSKKDFDDDFLEDTPKNHYVLKIILLIFFVVICGVAIFYFISNYGLN
jgi:hypothetical protein